MVTMKEIANKAGVSVSTVSLVLNGRDEGRVKSKIADNVALSTVIHKAKVIVDEQGTKAAAVTGAVVEMTALVEPEPEITFIADRPFFYVIEDADTGMILFMGQMNNMK